MGSWLGLFSQTFGGAASPPRDARQERWWGAAGGIPATAGVAVTDANALQLDVVEACLGALAGSISTLPMMVYEKIDDDTRKPARAHPLFTLLHRRPNERQSAQEFRDEQQRHLAFYRNCYSFIEYDADGAVCCLEPIHPSRVMKVERIGDRVYYTIRRMGNPGWDVYADDEIWHIRKAPLTQDGLQGRPVFQTASEVFSRAMAVKKFGSLFFANGGNGGGWLEHPGSFKSKEEEEDFIETFRRTRQGDNRFRDFLLKYGVKYNPGSVQNNEAQFIETIAAEDLAICRLWNMPPHRAGMLQRSTLANIEQQSIEYVVHTLAPWISAWEQAAARDLLIGDDRDKYFVEFNVAGLLRGDIVQRYEAYFKGRQGGWLSVNDVRKLENQQGIGPAGDVYESALNMKPAEAAPGSSKNSAADPAQGDDNAN